MRHMTRFFAAPAARLLEAAGIKVSSHATITPAHPGRFSTCIALCGLLCLATASAQAAVVTAVGMENNVRTWRTATVVKTLDGDGDNLFGTDGYYVQFNGGPKSLTPAYLTTFTSNSFVYSATADAQIDNPDDVSPPISTLETAQLYRSEGTAYFNITFGANAPSGVRLGVITDFRPTNEPDQVQRIFVNGVSLDVTEALNTTPDWFFFDITGISAGNTLTVTGITHGDLIANGGNAGIAGITFDTIVAVPEPSTLALAGLGGLGMLIAARRRRRTA